MQYPATEQNVECSVIMYNDIIRKFIYMIQNGCRECSSSFLIQDHGHTVDQAG